MLPKMSKTVTHPVTKIFFLFLVSVPYVVQTLPSPSALHFAVLLLDLFPLGGRITLGRPGMYCGDLVFQSSVYKAVSREGGFLGCELRGYDDGGEHLAAAA